MEPRSIPTSPKNRPVSNKEISDVWSSGKLQQPPKQSWGRIWLLVIFVSLVISLGLSVGLAWTAHHWPQSWIIQWLPLSTTTQIIQNNKEKDNNTIPTAVLDLTKNAYGLAVNQGDDGVYLSNQPTGLAWPLSSNGWVVTIDGAWSKDAGAPALLPRAGQSLASLSVVKDPATRFTFIKATSISEPPVTFNTDWQQLINQRVWIVSNQAAVDRQIVGAEYPYWSSADYQERRWKLDQSVNLPIGSAVVDQAGHLIGLLGTDSLVWDVEIISNAVRQVIQTGKIIRPQVGLKSINLSAALVSGMTQSNGALIGAIDGQAAVVSKSPADRAGLQSGDIITKIDSQPVTGDLITTIEKYNPGESVELEIIRNKQLKTVTLKFGTLSS